MRLILIALLAVLSCKSQVSEKVSKPETTAESNADLSDILVEDSPENKQLQPVIALKTYRVKSHELTQEKCTKCDVKPLAIIKKSDGNLSYQNLFDLFCTYDKSCSTAIEYLEFSNRMLYKVLSEYPADVVKLLSEGNFDLDYILLQIESPLLDYNYEGIIQEVEKASGDDSTKNRIISALEKAIEG